MARLMASAEAIVTRMSQEMNFVYFLAGKMPKQAISTATMQTQKNMSNCMSGTSSAMKGMLPNVAPPIIITSRNSASHFFQRGDTGRCSEPLLNIRKARESPQRSMNRPSVSSTSVSPALKTTSSRALSSTRPGGQPGFRLRSDDGNQTRKSCGLSPGNEGPIPPRPHDAAPQGRTAPPTPYRPEAACCRRKSGKADRPRRCRRRPCPVRTS